MLDKTLSEKYWLLSTRSCLLELRGIFASHVVYGSDGDVAYPLLSPDCCLVHLWNNPRLIFPLQCHGKHCATDVAAYESFSSCYRDWHTCMIIAVKGPSEHLMLKINCSKSDKTLM